MNTDATHPFFGFGANASPALMKALLGRIPASRPAILPNYRVYLQPWKAIRSSVRKALSRHWNSLFSVYVIRPKRGEKTKGRLWYLTPNEFKYLSKWDLSDGSWTEQVTVVCSTKEENEIIAETHILPYWDDRLAIAGSPKGFINPRSKMIAVARQVHDTILVEK